MKTKFLWVLSVSAVLGLVSANNSNALSISKESKSEIETACKAQCAGDAKEKKCIRKCKRKMKKSLKKDIKKEKKDSCSDLKGKEKRECKKAFKKGSTYEKSSVKKLTAKRIKEIEQEIDNLDMSFFTE